MSLTISSAATLTASTIAAGDLFPLLDVSAAAGSQGSKVTLSELSLAVASTLGFAATTVGKALLNLTNPGAVTFLQVNADNSVSALSASSMRTALGLGTMATQAASAVAITGGTFAGSSVQAGSGSGRCSVNHDINGVYLGSASSTIQFSDTYLSRGGAAHVLMMGVTSATPSAQCFKGPNGSGTNIAGGKLQVCPGQSTGSATPATLVFQVTAAGSSGSTAQSFVDVLTIVNSTLVRLESGVALRLGNAAVAATPAASHTLTVQDSTGTTYKLIAST